MARRKVHWRFNTRLGFPLPTCSPNKHALTVPDKKFKSWETEANLTYFRPDVTCENCKRILR